MGIVLQDDVLHHVLRHLLTILLRHNAKGECQQVGCGGIIAIEDGVWIQGMTRRKTGSFLYRQELAVEGLRHVLT